MKVLITLLALLLPCSMLAQDTSSNPSPGQVDIGVFGEMNSTVLNSSLFWYDNAAPRPGFGIVAKHKSLIFSTGYRRMLVEDSNSVLTDEFGNVVTTYADFLRFSSVFFGLSRELFSIKGKLFFSSGVQVALRRTEQKFTNCNGQIDLFEDDNGACDVWHSSSFLDDLNQPPIAFSATSMAILPISSGSLALFFAVEPIWKWSSPLHNPLRLSTAGLKYTHFLKSE